MDVNKMPLIYNKCVQAFIEEISMTIVGQERNYIPIVIDTRYHPCQKSVVLSASFIPIMTL